MTNVCTHCGNTEDPINDKGLCPICQEIFTTMKLRPEFKEGMQAARLDRSNHCRTDNPHNGDEAFYWDCGYQEQHDLILEDDGLLDKGPYEEDEE